MKLDQNNMNLHENQTKLDFRQQPLIQKRSPNFSLLKLTDFSLEKYKLVFY